MTTPFRYHHQPTQGCSECRAMEAERDALRDGLMVNMHIREDEALMWARRLIEADAYVLEPWLPQARAALREGQK